MLESPAAGIYLSRIRSLCGASHPLSRRANKCFRGIRGDRLGQHERIFEDPSLSFLVEGCHVT
jgi:hypothetical protein